MELWLLIGALGLIALTVWIVWSPQRPGDAFDSRSREEDIRMNNGTPNNMTPQGDAFEDQYTSATADLSAGGVATARETAAPAYSGADQWSAPTMAREGVSQPWSAGGTENFNSGTGQSGMPRTMGMGAGALLVAGGVGGAWLYARWQRERNRPINRLRRGARDLTSRLGERMPDTSELPEASGPLGGMAAALLLSSLVAARAMRRGSDTVDARAEQSRDVIWDVLGVGRKEAARRLRDADLQGIFEEGRKQAKRRMGDVDMDDMLDKGRKQAKRLPKQDMSMSSVPKPAMLGGLGLGGTAIVVGAIFVIWRLLRGGDRPNTYYVGDGSGE